MTETLRKKGFISAGDLFAHYQLKDKGGHITKEFQDFAYRLAVELDDLAHKSLYMRLAKNTKREFLEKALSFVKDAHHARSKARLFMWKVKQLKKAKEESGVKSEEVKKNAI